MSITRIISALLIVIGLGLAGCQSADGTYNTSSSGSYAESSANYYPDTGNGDGG